MVFISGTDKFIVRRVHKIPDAFNLTCGLIHKLLGCLSCRLCPVFYLLTMLICAGLEEYVISFQPSVSCNGIRQDYLICISDMRLAGCIGNGRCHVILTFIAHNILVLSLREFQ